MVEAGQADHIVVAYFDRLVRSLKVQLEVIERVEKAGGEIFALDHGKLTNGTAATRLSTNMMGAVFQYFAEVTGEKVTAAQARAVARGVLPNSRIVPGYVRGEDGVLVVVGELAPVVREVFQRRDRGAPIVELQAFLLERGIERSVAGVASMLRSRMYLGEIHFGELHNPRAHEPIVKDRGLFERVQRRTVLRGRQAKEAVDRIAKHERGHRRQQEDVARGHQQLALVPLGPQRVDQRHPRGRRRGEAQIPQKLLGQAMVDTDRQAGRDGQHHVRQHQQQAELRLVRQARTPQDIAARLSLPTEQSSRREREHDGVDRQHHQMAGARPLIAHRLLNRCDRGTERRVVADVPKRRHRRRGIQSPAKNIIGKNTQRPDRAARSARCRRHRGDQRAQRQHRGHGRRERDEKPERLPREVDVERHPGRRSAITRARGDHGSTMTVGAEQQPGAHGVVDSRRRTPFSR